MSRPSFHYFRYIYVEYPLRYITIVTEKRAIISIIIAWVLNIVQTGAFIKWDIYTAVSKDSCRFFNDNMLYQAGIYVFSFEAYFLTFFVLAPLYGKIAYTTYRLIQSEPHISNLPPEGQVGQRKKMRERKMTTTIGLTFGVYVICFLPITIFFGVASQIYTSSFPFWILLVNKIGILIHGLQLVLNPVIYSQKNQNMKRAYQKMFGKNVAINSF